MSEPAAMFPLHTDIPASQQVWRQQVLDGNQIGPPNHNTLIDGSFSTMVKESN